MFNKNDKSLLTTRIILIVVISILTAGCVLAGIIVTIVDENPIFLLISAGGALFCWLAWVIARLYLSYLCDIKLIRNKLYGIGNDNLQVFLTEKSADSSGSRPVGTSPSATASYTSASPAASSSAADSDKTNELLQLKKLLDMGAISQEEFDAEKARILRN